MNEELLKAIFENEGFAKKGISYDQFKIDIKDPSLQEAVFNNSGFSKKGITLDAFRNDLGLSNINNAEFIQITPDTLPTRNNKVFNAPVNKNLVNKLSGFMQNHDLVVTDTNDSKIHKSEAQQLGNSLDVNFNDRDINPIRVKNAIIDAQQRGLNLVYEIKDRRIYDAFIKSNPDLINNVKHIPHATANHFSVYDNDNIATPVESSEPAANLDLTQVINNDAIKLANTRNKEKLDKLPYLKRLAYDWERRSIVSDILDGNGYGMYQATKSEIEAAKLELVQSGKYGKFKNAEELAVVLDPNYKEKINKTVAAADKVQQNLEEDFNTDAGLFDTNPFGDNRGYRIDGRTGQKQADIMPTLWSGDDIGQYWMGVDKLMTLTEHPLITKNPKKYNHREQKELNQHLRDIQADISKPQQIKKEATTGYINNYLQYAQSRATALEKELTSKYGNLEKLSEEAKIKIQQDPLFQEYYEIGDGYAKEFANLENKSANFKLAEANDYLEKTFNKKEDENYKKNYATLGFLEKSLQNVASFTKDAVTGVMHMPGDVGILAGTGIDAIAGTDLGTTRSIASAYNADKISTTAIKEGVIPLSVKLDTEDEIYAIYNDKNEIERFTDGNYFTITDDKNSETFKKLLAEEKKSVNSGKPSWGFNTDAFLHSVREPMVDMVLLILGGGAARTLTTKIASVVGKTSRLGNTLIKAANSDRFLTFAGSFAGFSGKMMDGAIKEGGLVDSGDIFLATTAKVGLEAAIESFNPLGGRLFTDKLFSSLSKQQVKQLSKIISEEGVFKALPIIGRQFRKEILENGLGESMEEILATIIEPSVVNSILNNTIGTTYDTNFSIKDVAESALVGMASGFAMGGILEGGPTALSALNNKSGVINESLRAALQNKQIFDKIIEENKNKELQNASDSDIEKITAKYDTIKKVMDNAASYSEKVFKEHPDTGHVPSSGMQTLYSAVAFDKARKENKKYDLEEDINKNSASIDQDTKKLKELDLFIGAGLDFFNGIADTNKEAKIMSDTELKENYFSVYNEVKNIVAEVGATKNSDKQKLAIIKANTKLALLKAKNKTENKVDPEVITEAEKAVKVEADAAKQEAKELEAKEAVSKGTATPEQVQAELTKAKQSVDDLFTGQKTLKDSELPDFSIDLVQQILENTPDMLKGEIAEYIDKKLEKINAQAYRQQVQNLKAQEKAIKPINIAKLSPEEAFNANFGGNTELENSSWATYKAQYLEQLHATLSAAINANNFYVANQLYSTLKLFKSKSSFKDAYINDFDFREFVNANTNAVASKPNTAVTQDQKQAEADKKAKADAKKQQEISEKQKNIKDIANDPKLYDAAKVIVEKQYASQTFLVKELGITNEKAKELLQELEDNGVIGSHKVGKTRDIYIKSLEDFNNLVQPSAATTKKSASSSDINIVDTSSADIIAQLNKLITAQDKLEWLKQNNLITPIIIDGKSYNAIDYSDRIMVLAKIGKYNIPFYISTGQAGKKNVKAGDWYVVFGIGESGWINKGSEENINSQYDFLIFQKIAKILNEGVGNFNSREDDGNGKIKDFIGYLEDDITSINNFNSQMNLPITPAKNHNDGKTFYKNVNIVLDLVNNELVNITNNKKTNTKPVVTPQQQESINKINKLIEDGKKAKLVESFSLDDIEATKQEELDSIEYVDTRIYKGKEIKVEKWTYLREGVAVRDGNSKQELVDEINARYEAKVKKYKKESYYTLAGKLYQRVTQFFGSMIFDKASTVTNLANSTVVGNYFDTFGRMYYNNSDLTIEEFTAELKKRPDYKQLSKIEVAKLFDDSKQYFSDIKEQIKKDLNDDNLVFITDNIFVHSTFKNGEWDGVAGTLDMVVVDSTGKIHIYDFKTKAENNAKYPVTKKSLEDIAFGESSQQKWTKQQTAYSRLLKDIFGYTPPINIIVIPVKYETESFTGNYNSSSDREAFEPTPYNVSFGKTRPFIYKLTFDKNNKLVVALDSVTPVAKSAPLEVTADMPQNKISGIESYGSLVTASDAAIKALGPNPHSIDMIEAGFRTRTTRSESEMTKYAVKVGDVVKHFGKSADGTIKTIYARVTAIHPKGTPGWKGTWEKEGWRPQDVNVIDRFKNGAAAIEFEIITEPASSSSKVSDKQVAPEVKSTASVQEEKTPISNGKISVTANGFGALSVADNLLVTDYLKVGDPVFYELSDKSTDAKPVIEKVVYYKDKSFGQPEKGTKRIVLQEGFGKDEHKLTERFADEIKAGKERVETKATYVKLNKNKKLTPDNKTQLSVEEIEAIRPYLYVVGKSFNSNENIILLDSEKDGENFVSISDFISDLKDKHPDLKNFQEVENILRHDDVNGKVVFVKGNTIIPLDTITNRDYEPNKKFITEFLDRLSSEATGTPDWRIDIDGRFLADAVRKRSDVKDYTNETSPNFRGRLIEYFASGPQHRRENPTELIYKIKYNEEEGKSEPIYLTKEQALEELLSIRVNIDHAELRAENSEGLTNLLSDVLRVPATPGKGFTILYNVVGLDNIDSEAVTPNIIKLTSEPAVTLKEKETKNVTTAKELKEDAPVKRGGGKKRDFKISNVDYTGKVEEAVKYLKTRFEEIGVEVNDEVLRNLVKGTAAEGSKVWGAFHNAMVTLSSLSGEKIGKHEAMHVAFKMFLTKQQQVNILNELWSKYKDNPKYKGKEEQFKKEIQEFLTSENFDTNKDFKLTDQEQVNYTLKAVDILSSDKAKQVFNKGNKNNWSLDKILNELQIPKEQKQLILDLNITDREQLVLELASKYSYTIEINTAKAEPFIDRSEIDTYIYNNEEYIDAGFGYFKNGNIEITEQEYSEAKNKGKRKFEEKPLQNSSYYSNLTVPGGTNYTENEITTPLITPFIKGHAQFATDNGIGWFRSDDKMSEQDTRTLDKKVSELSDVGVSESDIEGGFRLEKGEGSKTRRILEVQSDLFQKGRDLDILQYYDINGIQSKEDANNIRDEKQNKFLQLLNKDNNWVNFFIKSVIQDSAKKGYEKVLFPSGNTASKIEGHTTLEEFKKQKEDRIKELETKKNNIKVIEPSGEKIYYQVIVEREQYSPGETAESLPRVLEEINNEIDNEINQLKQELERVEREGFGALKPIWNFYENTVTNILNKQYGKDNVKQITDEYGNTWNEVTINTTRDASKILLKSSSEQFYSEQSILTQLQEDLSDAFEDYKNTLLLPEGFSKKYPTISKFIEKLFNFIKKNYLIGRSYITNKKSIDQLFYEVENNILGRNFIGRRKKSVRDTFQKALDKLSEENKPDFKISDWTNEEVNKFANFLATDIFTNYLNDVYRNNSINEVLANNKNLSLETIIIKFTNSLEKTLDDYKNNVVKREELETSSDEYQILEATLKDIYKQYASNEANKVFKRIVNKKLGNRYAGIVEFDKLEEDSLTENDENIKEVDNTEIAQAESWQTKQGKIDAKTKSSARLREFFSGIPLRTRLIRNGKSERTTITDEDLFSTQYYSGDYIHNKLLLELSDNSNYEDFIKAVNGLVKKHQFGADIIAAIMNLKEEKLVEAYDNDTLELPLDIFTNLEKHSDYKLWILKDMYYAIGDQSNVQPIKTLTTNTGEQTTTVEIGLSVQNTDYDNAVRTIKESIDAILLEPIKKESFKNLLEQTITAINNKGKVAGLIIKVFAEMGYQVSDELLLNLQPTSFINNEEDNLSYLKKGLTSIVNDINDKTKTTIDPTGRGVDIPAKLISTYSTISSGLSYMNVEGENEFAHQNSNHLSRVGAIWAKGKDAMKEWVNNMRYVDGDPNKAIVLQSYLPIYNDMLDSANTFRLYLDGGTQVKGQTNSGKAYADMTFAELTAHSINLYLTKNNQKNAGNTIKKLHALFHVMVFSDSPKRMMLHAPTYNNEVGHDKIVDKLADIVYGELERVGYAKAQENTSINELEKLSVAGKLIHTIPQLNDVKIKINGKYMPFTDFFATDLWTNPNSAIQISDTTTYKGISKQGREFELPLKGGTYRGMVSQIIKETLASDYNHFRDTIYNSDVRKLVTSSATNNDIKDYYYNSYYYNISAGIMFSGDPAHYKLKNDSITTERVKRDKQVVSPNIHLAFEKENYDVIILEDVKANTSNVGNKEVAADLADASAWHTLERRIEILKASPDWELKEAEVLQALEAIQNNKYTQEDLKTVHLQIIKPFVYAQVNKELPVGDGVTAYFKLPIQLKNSEAVLLPTEAYRVYGNNTRYVRPQSLEEITADKYYSPELARTLYLMEKTNVGTVVFESGSKGEIFGKINLETYTEADINAITNPNNPEARAAIVLSLKNSDWGIQQEVPRKDLEAKVGQGTQEHKIMSANVDDNWTFTMENTGEIFKGQQGANDLLQRIQETFVKENYDALLEKITNADGNLNTPEILAIISEALEEKFTNVDTIEGLEIQTDGKTLTPLELFGKKAEKVLNSLFKTISKIKGSGAALVNKTSVGYIRDVEFDKDKGEINLSNDLKLVRDKKGNILYYEAIVPVYNPIIYQFIDNNGELKTEKKIIDGKEVDVPTIPEKLLYSFFYRIPTEDKYSMFPIKIKKFSMPVEGGGIILPREATQTAGLDFDIDKLYGYYYNFKVNYPPEFKTFITNKFNKIIIGDASKYVNALEDATLLLNFTDDELDNFDILKVNLNNYLNQYDRLDNKFLTKTKDFIKLTESSLNNSKSAHNLKLDVYFSLVNTEAYTRDALTPGNKDRLTALRNELVGSHYQPKYSYGDPSFIAKSANKNIVGKRLIGIFANGNSFYNLIQGIAKIMLKNPITFTANGVTYTFDSIGGINHQISKNIAELLFASTEDVKDPVLEPLNINTHTAPLLVTLLSMTNGTDIIKFEDAIKLLSDQSIIDAVKKAESEGKKFTNVYPRNGKYYDLVQMSEKYNAIVSASKIDQAIGPDFFTVQSKVSSIDNIIKDSIIETTYPFTLDSVKSILPSRLNKSSIKQLNIFREALDKELELFANVFSFLKNKVISTLDQLEAVSKTGKLAPDKKYTLAYYMYDAAIQNLYGEEVIQDLVENFPTKLFEYNYPGNTGILKQAFEIDRKGIVKMRWVNTNATNILEQYKEAFSDLFTLDPKMAEKLAKYAFLTGTKFKMDSIVKIVPNEFYKEGVGKQIRDIINGNTLETYLPDDIADTMMINHYKLILAKEELEFEGTLGLARSTKPYIWNNHKGVDIIYKHLGSGRYEEYHKVEKTKFPNYLINIKNNSNFAVTNQNIQNNNISENIINYINSIYPNWINENNIISLAAEFMYNSSIGEETPLEQRIFFGKDALETLKNYTENKKPFANSVKIDDVITNIIYNIISGKLAEDGILEKDMYNNIFNFKKQENSNIDNSSVTPDVITDSSNTPQDFKNYSGGALGADKFWEKVAKEYNIGEQVNFTPDDLKRLTLEQREKVESAYQQAVKDLGRKPLSYNWENPQKEDYSGGLVRRDYLQAVFADAIFAVSTIVQPGQKDSKGYVNKKSLPIISGGTGYAVQMAINLGKPVYVFDQLQNKWFIWKNNDFIETSTPKLTKNFAGIGTRELNDLGKMAIKNVFANTFNTDSPLNGKEITPCKK